MPGRHDMAPALTALAHGLLIGLPTDTVYGIAADPGQEAAVRLLYAVKGREENKPIPILAASLVDARRFGLVPDEAAAHWPGALTVVVPRTPQAPHWVGDPVRDTVAIRVPAHPLALELLTRSGPLAVTSANKSGEPAARDDTAARAALGDAVALYLPGEAPGGRESTVVDLTGFRAVVLRAGPVAWER